MKDLKTLDGQFQDQLSPDEIFADDKRSFEYQEYQEKIFQAIAVVKDFWERAIWAELDSQQGQAPSPETDRRQQSTDHLKLLRLDLPTFDCTYIKRVSFFD